METILEYIMLNYTWILAGSIIILLAIIGYYADKTNFGQGKTNDNNDEENINMDSLKGKRMEDLLTENNSELDVSNDNASIEPSTNDNETVVNNNETFDKSVASNLDGISNQVNSLDESEEIFENFEKEFNELLPKKEIIDDDLLEEINSLSLDKTQKINISDIPDVDDVDLPEIKTLSKEQEDIWKF